MKLSVAPLSKRALMEWSLLVFIVPIFTGRSKKVSQMVTYLICDLRKEFFKIVQARFR